MTPFRQKRRGGANTASSRWSAGIPLISLPCPDPSTPEEVPLGPHGHRCTNCGVAYRCAGPDDTGFCAPVCAPCYWVEIGSQLRVYRAVVAALERKQQQMEELAGREACERAEQLKRKVRQAGRLLVGFEDVVARRSGIGADASRGGDPTSEKDNEATARN